MKVLGMVRELGWRGGGGGGGIDLVPYFFDPSVLLPQQKIFFMSV